MRLLEVPPVIRGSVCCQPDIRIIQVRRKMAETDLAKLCECGHPLIAHSVGGGECYKSIRQIEKKANHLGQQVNVNCEYTCACDKYRDGKI